MSDLQLTPSTHGQAYTDDPNYERNYGLFGASHEVIRYDWTLRRYRKMVVQPLRKASDPIDVADPDVVIDAGDEGLFNSGPKVPPWTYQRERMRQRDLALIERIREGYAKHGPMAPLRMGQTLGIQRQHALRLIRETPDTFVCIDEKHSIWGLPGQTWEFVPARRITPLMKKIIAHLTQHGPMIANDIGDAIGSHGNAVRQAMSSREELFVVVQTIPGTGKTPATGVWGLVGVHDE